MLVIRCICGVSLGCTLAATVSHAGRPPVAADTSAAARVDKRTDAGKRAEPAKRRTTRSKAKSTKSKKQKVAVAKARSSESESRSARSTAEHLSAPDDAADAPAVRYAQLSQDACEAELTRREIGFTRETVDGVLAPVRLTGPVNGVEFRSNQSARARRTSKYEIVDCRLVLAIDDFTEILRRHDIVEVRHYSMYRPPRSGEQPGKRHPAGLAIDTGKFIDSTGAVLDVDKDWHGAIDARTCGEGAAPHPVTPEGLKLRTILCEAADQRLFNVVLTPNYNRPHKNHFHLEVTAGVRWFLVH
jgi:hypothetical protein